MDKRRRSGRIVETMNFPCRTQNTIKMVLDGKYNTLTFAPKFEAMKIVEKRVPVMTTQMCECVRMSMCMRGSLCAGTFSIVER
jgi:hypothetical protein